ncbi:hypothetical protein R6K83_12865, partial [Enterococcus faecium]|nr:hypothetical protein [Enterococcus faecium]
MYADKKKIEWLLFDSGKSVRSISIESGVPLTTVSDLANKRSSIDGSFTVELKYFRSMPWYKAIFLSNFF